MSGRSTIAIIGGTGAEGGGIAYLAERTRTGKLTPDDPRRSTFTLTNTGSLGALFDTPIVNRPQVAILGTGVIAKRPVVVTDDAGSDSIASARWPTSRCRTTTGWSTAPMRPASSSAIKARLEEGAFEAEFGLG